MSVTAAIVLAVLQHQPPCWEDRKLDRAVKALQLEVIAEAISEVSPDVPRAAYLITIGYAESRWCVSVHAGLRRGGHGDGLWQLEGSHHGPGARSGLSLAETVSAARMASAQLQRSRQCGTRPADVLTAYAGRPCYEATTDPRYPGDSGAFYGYGWPTLESRVNSYWRAYSALRRGQK